MRPRDEATVSHTAGRLTASVREVPDCGNCGIRRWRHSGHRRSMAGVAACDAPAEASGVSARLVDAYAAHVVDARTDDRSVGVDVDRKDASVDARRSWSTHARAGPESRRGPRRPPDVVWRRWWARHG